MELRDYQREAIDGLYAYFKANDGNPLLVLPTGAGKSVVLAFFLRETFERWPDQRVIVLTHVKELIAQNYRKLLDAWPDAPAGINSAGIGRRDQNHPILFAGIQSVHKRALDFDPFNLVVIDECHLVGRNRNGMYRRFLDDLWLQNPSLKVIGMTATHYRLDSGLLIAGPDRIFTDVAYELPVTRLIDAGHLSTLISKPSATQADLSAVHTRRGDYIDSEAASAFNAILDAAIAEICELGKARKSWLIFTHSIGSAIDVAKRLQDNGIAADYLSGKTPKTIRDNLIEQYKAGKIRALVNCAVLTTGFDAPQTDLLILLRATKSIGLYVQICGRAMRTAPGKENAMVLDYGGNIARHGPLDAITVKAKKSSDKVSVEKLPTRTCPECETIVSVFERTCPDCGYQWPLIEPAIDSSASSEAILSKDVKPQWIALIDTHYSTHRKQGKPDSVKFSYIDHLGYVCAEWMCVGHEGYARQKSMQKLVKFLQEPGDFQELQELGIFENAASLIQALDEWPHIFRWPTKIKVKKPGKYYEVVGYEFDGSASAGIERNDARDISEIGSRERTDENRDDQAGVLELF